MATRELVRPKVKQTEKLVDESHKLILFNDEVNTFDWVIECLMKVCGHTAEQAEQCAWIVHHHGKYVVLHGSLRYLEPRCDALLLRGLNAEVH